MQTRRVSRVLAVLALLWAAASAESNAFDVTTSSYLGDSADDEAVVGLAIQSDGDIVVVANLGPETPAMANAVVLNGASASSAASVLILAPDGKSVKFAARIGTEALDVALDGQDRIYIALAFEGGIALNADANAVRWTFQSDSRIIQAGLTRALVHRVDVGRFGTVAFLMTANQTSPTMRPRHDVDPGPGFVLIFNADGQRISRFVGAPGNRNILDVVMDEEREMIILVGWKQSFDWLVAGSLGGPVQIGLIRGVTFTGELLWVGYDWHTNPASLDGRYLNEISLDYRSVDANGNVTFLFKPDPKDSNMADTRLYRAVKGEDGELYVTGHSAGGNHMYRWSPMDVLVKVDDLLANYDFFASYAGAKDQHLGFVGRFHYNRTAIEFAGGQGVVARLSAILPNTLHAEGGAIAADMNSRLYYGGISACCLPFPPNDIFVPSPGEVSLNPFAPTEYLGGAFMLAFNFNASSSKITGRAFGGRVVQGKTKAIAARTIDGVTRVVWGGYASLSNGPLWTADALQRSPGYGATDGWFLVNYPGLESPQVTSVKTLSAAVVGVPVRVNATTPVTVLVRNTRNIRINGTDLDGNTSTNDARFLHPWSDTEPLTPARGFAPLGNVSYVWNGHRYFGGLLLDVTNVNDSRGLRRIVGEVASSVGGAPRLFFGSTLQPGERAFMRAAIFAYVKEIFNGSITDRFSFDSKSSITIVLERFAVWTVPTYRICMSKKIRFLVRNGATDWYISERILPWMGEGPAQWFDHIHSFDSSSSDGRWAFWNPSTSVAFKFNSSEAEFMSVDFQDVQAVGFWIEDDDWHEAPWLKPVPGSNPPYYLTPAEQFTTVADNMLLRGIELTMVKNMPANRPPLARFTMSSSTIRVGDTVVFDATSSQDPDGFISFTSWDFGDGTRSSGPTETHIYRVAGNYMVKLTVSDEFFDRSTQIQRIYVVPPFVLSSDVSSVAAAWWGADRFGILDCIGVVSCTSESRAAYRGVADLDNDGAADDFYFDYPFASQRALFIADGTKLDGGWRFESLNTRFVNASLINEWPRLSSAGHNNPLLAPLWDNNGVRAAVIGWEYLGQKSNLTRYGALFAIDKTEFVNGGRQSVVSFDENSSLHAGPWQSFGRNTHFMRFAVRDGEQWFVSEYFYRPNVSIEVDLNSNTGYGNASAVPPVPASPTMMLSNPNLNSRWVAWNPVVTMFAPVSGYSSRVFTNVTAFGVAMQLPDWTSTKIASNNDFVSAFRMGGMWMKASLNLGSLAPIVARLSVSRTEASTPASIVFDASASTSGATIREYVWDFGDGVASTTTGPVAPHVYSISGAFTASVTVVDDLDRRSTISVLVRIRNPTTGSVGSEFNFAGESSITVREGDSQNFTVSRIGDLLGTVSVSFRIDHETADGNDYVTEVKRLLWASGDLSTRNISIRFNRGDGLEEVEQFRLVLADPYGGATLGSASAVTILIIDESAVESNSVNAAGIAIGVVVAVVVAVAIGLAIWKRNLIRAKFSKL